MPTARAELETVELIKYKVPGHGDCINKFAIPQFTECFGTCNSGAKYNKDTHTFENTCKCCTIKEMTNVPVELTCKDNHKYTLDVAVAKSCQCSACREESPQQQQGIKTGQPQYTKTKGKY